MIEAPEVRANELQRFVRSTTAVEVLCVVLVGLVFAWAPAGSVAPRPLLALMGVYAVAIVAFQSRKLFARETRTKLKLQCWVMLAFITGAAWLTGKSASPLLGLYLLPIIVSALVLGRWSTFALVIAVCTAHVLLAAANPQIDVFSLRYASLALGMLAPFVLVAYLTSSLSADVSEARGHLENLAQIDALSGLMNMRAFDEFWLREHARLEAERAGYALIVVGIDRLKSINDSYGHAAGDSAIVLVAQCIQRCIRATDCAARLGGDEFVVLLPTATPDSANAIEKRIRNTVYNTTLDVRSRMIRCTVSVGVVAFPKDARDPRELMALADRRMRRDKELRRPPPTTVD